MKLDSIHVLHHAYVLEGDIKTQRQHLIDFTTSALGIHHTNPDFFEFDRDVFTVAHAHEVLDANSRRPLTSGGKKVILISLQSISHQAQNALLKVLEEPQQHTLFFILTQSSSIFLPTVLSRVHVIKSDDESVSGREDSSNPTGKSSKSKSKLDNSIPDPNTVESGTISSRVCTSAEFLASSPAVRISYVKKIIDLKTKEDIQDSDIIDFVRTIEKKVSRLLYPSKEKKDELAYTKRKKLVEALYLVSDHIRDVSSSKKMLLEYLALQIPRISL